MTISDATWRVLLAPGLGATTVRALRTAFDSDERIVEATTRELATTGGLSRRRAMSVRRALDEADPDVERRALAEHGASLVALGAPDYPALLATIPDPPLALRVRGNADMLDAPSIALVGSRRASSYGRAQAARFSGVFARAGLVVLSGGARGIDAEAHRAALRCGGATAAVLGCGLDHVYPPEHGRLYDEIVSAGGAVISEHECAVPPRPGLFPRRNRIVSGLSLGVLVIEAASRSGALITARLAAEEHGREVFALPGRVDDRQSRGCLELIAKGGAQLITDPGDIFTVLRHTAGHLTIGAHEATAETSSALAHDDLLEALGDTGATLDELVEHTGREVASIMARITILEIQGAVTRRGARIVRT